MSPAARRAAPKPAPTPPDEPTERELERVIAGAVVLGAPLSPIRGVVNPDDFRDAKLAQVVRAGLAMEAEGIERDNMTLASRLSSSSFSETATWLDAVGGRAGLVALQADCPAVAVLPDYARLFTENVARRHGRPVAPRSITPQVEPLGLGYRAVFPGASVEFVASRIREAHGELTAELDVRMLRPGPGSDGHLFRGRQNLSNLAPRTTLARGLAARTPGFEIPWPEIVERASVGFLDAYRAAGGSFTKVGGDAALAIPPPTMLVSRVVAEGMATHMYGAGGVGKSTLAAAIAVSLQTGREIVPGFEVPLTAPVLILDYEARPDDWSRRIAAIANGAGIRPPEIAHRRMSGSFAASVEEIAAFADREGIALVVVDSLGLALGVGREGADANDSTLRLYAALRELGRASLLVDHIAGRDLENPGAAAKSYGSVYRSNLARLTFEVRRERDPKNGVAEIALVFGKFNEGPKLRPVTLRMVYGAGTLRFEEATASAPEIVAVTMTNPQRILAALAGGPLSVREIKEATGIAADTIRTTCSRLREAGSVVKGKNGVWQKTDQGSLGLG